MQNKKLKIKNSESGYTHTPNLGVTPKGGGYTHTPNLGVASKRGGYTIIETMISISIFLIIIMSGMGALLNANVLHQKSQDVRSILDNLSFVLEDMSRNLRTGLDYQCFNSSQPLVDGSGNVQIGVARSCESGWAIAFETATGTQSDGLGNNHYEDQWVYYILNGHVYKSIDGMNTSIQLTPNEVVVDAVSQFSVLGAEAPTGLSGENLQQPLVVIRLVGKITTKNIATPFSLQTAVSQRLIDI